MKELYIIARTESKDTLNKAKPDKWKEFISTLTHKTNSKHIWNVIAKFNGKPFKPVEVLKSNNVRYHDNKEMLLLNITKKPVAMNFSNHPSDCEKGN